MTPQETIVQLQSKFPDAVGPTTEFRGEHSVEVKRERLVDICRFLKFDCEFDMLTDLSGIDHYGNASRYEVGYILYSMAHRCHLRLKVRIPEEDAVVDSVTGIWQTANWHEREAFDMFGIQFRGHPNLKRILMWEGYPFHPLRKDFPLAGLPADLPQTARDAGRAETSPMAGGPFVAGSGVRNTLAREPRQYDTGVEQIVKISNPYKKESV